MGKPNGLVAEKEPMFPFPVIGNPMFGLLFVQVKLFPVPVKLMGFVVTPLHTLWLGMKSTCGVK